MLRILILLLAAAVVMPAQNRIIGGGGGGASKPPKKYTFTSATTFTKTGVEHEQGNNPIVQCRYNSTGTKYVPIALTTDEVDETNGDISLAWTPARTGYCLVSTGNGGGKPGPQGVAGYGYDPFTGTLTIGDGTVPGAISWQEVLVNGTHYRELFAQSSFADTLRMGWADAVPTTPTIFGLTQPSGTPSTATIVHRPLTGDSLTIPTFTGATTAGKCVHTGANGNLEITANDCGTGGGGTATQMFSVMVGAAMVAGTSNQHVAISGQSPSFSSSINARSTIMIEAGTFTDLRAFVAVAGTSDFDITCVMNVNGTNSSLSLVIPFGAGSGTPHSGSTGSATVAVGDVVAYRCTHSDLDEATMNIASFSAKFTK